MKVHEQIDAGNAFKSILTGSRPSTSKPAAGPGVVNEDTGDEPLITIEPAEAKRLGLAMMDWHSSASDPIYAAGSFLYGGHAVNRDTLIAAIANLRKNSESSAQRLATRLERAAGLGQKNEGRFDRDAPGSGQDTVSANELVLFIDNDGDLYRRRTTPIHQNLLRKIVKGEYDHTKAPLLWLYLADAGAKKYASIHGTPGHSWSAQFPKPTRQAAAKQMADTFLREVQVGGINPSDFGLKGAVPEAIKSMKISESRKRTNESFTDAAVDDMMSESVKGLLPLYRQFLAEAAKQDTFRQPDEFVRDTATWYGPGGKDSEYGTVVERGFDGFNVSEYTYLKGYVEDPELQDKFSKQTVFVGDDEVGLDDDGDPDELHYQKAARIGTDRIAETGGDESTVSSIGEAKTTGPKSRLLTRLHEATDPATTDAVSDRKTMEFALWLLDRPATDAISTETNRKRAAQALRLALKKAGATPRAGA